MERTAPMLVGLMTDASRSTAENAKNSVVDVAVKVFSARYNRSEKGGRELAKGTPDLDAHDSDLETLSGYVEDETDSPIVCSSNSHSSVDTFSIWAHNRRTYTLGWAP